MRESDESVERGRNALPDSNVSPKFEECCCVEQELPQEVAHHYQILNCFGYPNAAKTYYPLEIPQ
jgi:hypothetical protein